MHKWDKSLFLLFIFAATFSIKQSLDIHFIFNSYKRNWYNLIFTHNNLSLAIYILITVYD